MAKDGSSIGCKAISLLLPVLAISSFGLSSPAYAEDDRCRSIIPPTGAVRTIDLSTKNEIDLLDYSLIKRSSSKTSNLDSSGNATIPIEGVPVSFGGTFKNAKSKYSAVESARYYELHQSEMIDYRLVEGDPILVQAWSDCVGKTRGLSASFSKLSNDGLKFKLNIQWIPAQNNQSAQIPLSGRINIQGYDKILSNNCEKELSEYRYVGAVINRIREWWSPNKIGPGGCDIVFTRKSMRDSIHASIPTEAQSLTVSLPGTTRFKFENIPYPQQLVKYEVLPAHGEKTKIRERVGYGDNFAEWRIYLPSDLRNQGWVFQSGSEKVRARMTSPEPGECHNNNIIVEDFRILVSNGASVKRGDTRIPCEFMLDVNLVRIAEIT